VTGFDPRVTPARPDLAAAGLEGKVDAERFVEGVTRVVVETSAPLRREPRHDAKLDTEALYGERVTVYHTDGEGWAWGQIESDGYVGYLPANALVLRDEKPTHRVSALRTFLYPEPDIKAPPIMPLSFGSRVAVTRAEKDFAVTAQGAIFARHLAPLAQADSDFAATARKFTGTPYLWGGRTSLGLDCSALVQLSLSAAGIRCPRDSDMQERALGDPVPLERLQRGDLVFWKGHVAIACDAETLVHANAFHMAVEIEPLAQAVERIAALGARVTSVKRIATRVVS
jgi:cell wall-associated NlpC family hydrolase